jgi:hypothetical protein
VRRKLCTANFIQLYMFQCFRFEIISRTSVNECHSVQNVILKGRISNCYLSTTRKQFSKYLLMANLMVNITIHILAVLFVMYRRI